MPKISIGSLNQTSRRSALERDAAGSPVRVPSQSDIICRLWAGCKPRVAGTLRAPSAKT